MISDNIIETVGEWRANCPDLTEDEVYSLLVEDEGVCPYLADEILTIAFQEG